MDALNCSNNRQLKMFHVFEWFRAQPNFKNQQAFIALCFAKVNFCKSHFKRTPPFKINQYVFHMTGAVMVVINRKQPNPRKGIIFFELALLSVFFPDMPRPCGSSTLSSWFINFLHI